MQWRVNGRLHCSIIIPLHPDSEGWWYWTYCGFTVLSVILRWICMGEWTSIMTTEPDALAVVNQLRDLATDPMNRRAIVQDQGCLPGLILFLDHTNPQVVYSALLVSLTSVLGCAPAAWSLFVRLTMIGCRSQAIRYLSECRANREKLKSVLGMMLSLQNIVQRWVCHTSFIETFLKTCESLRQTRMITEECFIQHVSRQHCGEINHCQVYGLSWPGTRAISIKLLLFIDSLYFTALCFDYHLSTGSWTQFTNWECCLHKDKECCIQWAQNGSLWNTL